MNLFDAHTHLNSEILFPDRQIYLNKFIENGWKWLINVWASDYFNQKGIQIAKSFNQTQQNYCLVKSTLWYHPEECSQGIITETNLKAKINQISDLFLQNQKYIVAIWECGIDLHYPEAKTKLTLQKKIFALQCDLAQELNLPLIVHSRDWFEETLDVLKNYKNLKIYFHCRGYWVDKIKELKKIWLKNLFIWFCGNVSYKKANSLRESLKETDLDQLLLETDAPWLSPQIVRWQQNEPANIKYIYDFVSDFLNIKKEILANKLEKNFKKMYEKL
jgi:TatD DNase family protein